MNLKDRFLGTIYGLAVGDALGAPPVEFMDRETLINTFGPNGVTDFHSIGPLRKGAYTDDTQMSIATAIGLICAEQRHRQKGICHVPTVVWRQYQEWLRTQEDPYQRRAPGITCVSSIASGIRGTVDKPLNDSKGCGGVMRVAPVGLVVDRDRSFELGMELAALTHGHPTGYLTAGFLAKLIAEIIRGNSLAIAVTKSIDNLRRFSNHEETLSKVLQASELAYAGVKPKVAIPAIGAGWVAEETLGIGVYCAFTSPRSYRDAVLNAVNFGGDRDSCGSVTGAIMGAMLGIKAIPQRWVDDVENSAYLRKLATDLYDCFVDGKEMPEDEYPPY